MLCSVLVRRLKPGKTYEDFRNAWIPDVGFGIPTRVVNARALDDPSEIISIGFVDTPAADLPELYKRVADSEAHRHERTSHVIEATILRGMYEILDDDDLS
ncbi:MAG: hypothetical protein MPJ78_18315 [Hyphomicrobiaceae bacterium]|nr:hypothetical protein [Hyphomicrobiaceae bacterium]